MRRLRGGCERVPWGRGEGDGDGDGSAMMSCAASGVCGTSRSQKFCEREVREARGALAQIASCRA